MWLDISSLYTAVGSYVTQTLNNSLAFFRRKQNSNTSLFETATKYERPRTVIPKCALRITSDPKQVPRGSVNTYVSVIATSKFTSSSNQSIFFK
jgi:hypothetical protein